MAKAPSHNDTADAKSEVWTVSELNRRVKGLLESNVGKVWVAGEISNWRVSPAGHAYFTLKDDRGQISAAMFKGKISRLKFEPEAGLEVMVQGQVTLYEARGTYQIICDTMQPQGVGALQLAFDQLKAKLDAEGLFDEGHKKPLPLLPRKIGIVTSPTGAAIQDMLNVLDRRFGKAHVILYPARVQGVEAAPEIVAGIEALDEWGVDVIIVGRGGGSLEDMWPFNEEIVVRSVYECATPIVSAVGHEIDFSLSDFAADLRAPTPSAAAELVVKEYAALVEQVGDLKTRLSRSLKTNLESWRNRLDRARASYIFLRPEELIRQPRQQVDDLRMELERITVEDLRRRRVRVDRATRSMVLLSPDHQLRRAVERLAAARQRLLHAGASGLERHRGLLGPLAGRLDALSPLAILSRGYALVRKAGTGELVSDAKQLKKNDTIEITLGSGRASAIIEDAKPEGT
jgi:exodeoxyribonuclease VII large subunit